MCCRTVGAFADRVDSKDHGSSSHSASLDSGIAQGTVGTEFGQPAMPTYPRRLIPTYPGRMCPNYTLHGAYPNPGVASPGGAASMAHGYSPTAVHIQDYGSRSLGLAPLAWH